MKENKKQPLQALTFGQNLKIKMDKIYKLVF